MVTGVQYLMTDPAARLRTDFSEVGAALPAGKSVLAQQTYWLARPEEPYISWEQLVYYRRYVQGSTLEDAFRALKPDYLIVGLHCGAILGGRHQCFPAEHRQFAGKQRGVQQVSGSSRRVRSYDTGRGYQPNTGVQDQVVILSSV